MIELVITLLFVACAIISGIALLGSAGQGRDDRWLRRH